MPLSHTQKEKCNSDQLRELLVEVDSTSFYYSSGDFKKPIADYGRILRTFLQ